jgi:hypothetical protein
MLDSVCFLSPGVSYPPVYTVVYSIMFSIFPARIEPSGLILCLCDTQTLICVCACNSFVCARSLGHFWPQVDYTLGNLQSKSICSIPKFPLVLPFCKGSLYEMVVPGSTLATLSIIYAVWLCIVPSVVRRHRCPLPTTTAYPVYI